MELWFTERQKSGVGITCKVLRILHREITPYQEIVVLDTEQFGRMLVLDGMIQTTIFDEFVYHEMLAHVPLYTHPAPRDVLIIGGGDGGTAREVLRHPEVEKITLVEIDRRVVEISSHFLPELACAFDHPKVEVCFEDGVEYVRKKEASYDVILVDSPEPVGQAARLFSSEFYQGIFQALRPDGLFVAQTESPFYNNDLIAKVYQEVHRIFPIAKLYLAVIPTYPSGLWSFTLGSKRFDPEAISEHCSLSRAFRYYSPEIHQAAFKLPAFVRAILPQGVKS
ncbi:MAG: polyamine aminopropyltransferase [Firmicutes bacterium]|nr:polyamine aminopropyltransferase [Bacillota bacterium]